MKTPLDDFLQNDRISPRLPPKSGATVVDDRFGVFSERNNYAECERFA